MLHLIFLKQGFSPLRLGIHSREMSRKNSPFQFVRLACCFFCTLIPFCGYSQTKDTASVHIREVEVRGEKVLQTNKTTSPVQVVNDKDIVRLGIQSMADAVRRFAGVVVKDYGGIGGLKTVSIRGFGSQHTGVSIDGITVSDAQSGQIDIGRFSLENISQISLETGQSDNIFQPARNFASVGMLHITTKAPDFNHKSYSGNVKIKTGSFGQFNPSVLYNKQLSSDWALSANGEWQRADGNYPFKFNNGSELENRKRYNSDVTIYRFETNVYKKWADRGELVFKNNYFDSRRGLPGSTVSISTNATERLKTKTFFSQLSAQYKLSNSFNWKGAVKFTHNFDRYSDWSTKYADSLLVNKYKQYEYYASSTVLYTPSSSWQFSFAEDFIRNYIWMFFRSSGVVDEDYPAQNKAYRNTTITAINAKYNAGKIIAQGGLVGGYYAEQVQSGATPSDKKRISPNISFLYEINKEWNARFFYKDIYRVPTFNDMYYTQIGNRTLKPEIARQLNIGATYKKYFPNGQQSLNISLDGYYNHVKDKIVATPTMFVWKMMNVDKVRIVGIDAKASYARNLTSKVRLYVNGTYSYQSAEDIETKLQIIYTPEHSGNFSLACENPWINVSYSLIGCTHQWTADYHSYLNKMKGYTDHSVSFNKSFELKKHQLKLQLDLLNLTNKNYEIIKNYPMPGRSFMASGNWTF